MRINLSKHSLVNNLAALTHTLITNLLLPLLSVTAATAAGGNASSTSLDVMPLDMWENGLNLG